MGHATIYLHTVFLKVLRQLEDLLVYLILGNRGIAVLGKDKNQVDLEFCLDVIAL